MGAVRSFDLPALMERYGCRTFFETGTGSGTGLAHAAEQPFARLFSVEIHDQLAEQAKTKFQPDSRVVIFHGTSEDAFNQILPGLPRDEPVLFWLDAHFPGADFKLAKYDGEQKEEVRLPLELELRLIRQHRPDCGDVILIDDLRIYEDGPFQQGNMPDYAQTLPPERRHIRFVEEVVGDSHTVAKFYYHTGYLALLPRGRGNPGPLLAAELGPKRPPDGAPWAQLGSAAGPRFQTERDDGTPGLVDLIDGRPGRVLDIACFTGLRGAILKQRFPDARVVGVEGSPAAAELAAARLDLVCATGLERVNFAAAGLTAGSQDVIMMAEVLEQMHNPWHALAQLRSLLAPGGQVLACIQNVRSLRVLESVAKSNWNYQGGQVGGVLDINNLRYFSRRDVQALFKHAGLKITKFVSLQDPRGPEILENNKGKARATIDIPGVITLHDLEQQDLIEMVTAKFLVAAVAA